MVMSDGRSVEEQYHSRPRLLNAFSDFAVPVFMVGDDDDDMVVGKKMEQLKSEELGIFFLSTFQDPKPETQNNMNRRRRKEEIAMTEVVTQ